MYNNFELAQKFLQYYFTASNSKGHGMHSPFVFDFIINVLNNKCGYDTPEMLEKRRSQLLLDHRLLEVVDMGAGSRNKSVRNRKVSQLAKTALKPKKYAQLLYRLVRHFEPQTIIELGTSLGLTTAYLAAANTRGRVVTIEGSEAVASVANETFKKAGVRNVELVTGNFDTELPQVLNQVEKVDLAYIDGNHRYEPTLRYFQQLLEKADSNSIFVFDDIHWSGEMEKAWEEIKTHESVQYSIDIFFLGFVFFRKEFKVKQHFFIRY